MNPMRVAFDMDGTLADLASAYLEAEARLFGLPDPAADGESAAESKADEPEPVVSRGRSSARRREAVWSAIEATPNFWTTLKPLETGAVRRLFDISVELNWEVFFITQRPATAGRNVQWQTHSWLVEHGFETPNVLPLSGSRGRAIEVLHIDYLVDDTPQNCVDVMSESPARTILLVDPADEEGMATAQRLGIGVSHTVHAALDVLVGAAAARANPSLFEKLRKMVGWK